MGLRAVMVVVLISILVMGSIPNSINSDVKGLDNGFVPSDPVHCPVEAATSQFTRDVDFTLSKSFDISNVDDLADVADRSAVDVVDEISSFMPEGTSFVEEVDVYVTSVSLDITSINVIEDRDIGAGEIYLEVILNRYSEYTFDNGGAYYIANDGDIVSTSISLDSDQYTVDGLFLVEILGWESDIDADDFMGGEYFYLDLSDLSTPSYSGWYSLNDYPPVGGNNAVQLQVYIELEFTNTDIQVYPDEFSSPVGDASYLISAIYMPKLYYDTFDKGDIPGIQSIYHRVYYGYDESIGANAYLIYYMFYYEYETDNFGALFGHYYDFEPLLLFVEDLGDEPYRIVYRDVGTHTLPPKVIIQDQYASTTTGDLNVTVSTELTPILGDDCLVEYEIRNDYWSTSAYQYETDHGMTTLMDVPIFTITNTYHQMELGIVVNNVEVILSPLYSYMDTFTTDVIKWGYSLLDEAFESSINVYEGVNLWNGADYRVPNSMSLTMDMLFNPYEFPYVVDCYEEIVHITEVAQDYKENGFNYDIDLQLDFILPATVTITLPTTVNEGESYDIDIGIQLDSSDITVKFEYDIVLGYILEWWFIGIEEEMQFTGDIEFQIDLEAIADILSFLEVGDDSVSGTTFGEWITVSNFETSTDLLSTMLDAEVKFHLFQIVSDVLSAFPAAAQVMDIIGIFIDEVNLIASPSISGYVTTDIIVDSSAVTLSTTSLTFDEGQTQKTIEMDVVGGSSTTSIQLDNMQYHTLFSTDWELELDFSSIANNFVDDQIYAIGTFPEVTLSSSDHSISASTTTGFTAPIQIEILSSGGVPTDGTDPTGEGALGSLSPLMIPILLGVSCVGVIVALVVLKTRKGS